MITYQGLCVYVNCLEVTTRYHRNNPINFKVIKLANKSLYYKIHKRIESQDYKYLFVKQNSSITYATGLAHI